MGCVIEIIIGCAHDRVIMSDLLIELWMDLTDRKAAGEHVDSKNIKKHKNDVFRLTELIDPTAKIVAPQGVYADIQEFVQRMKNENVDIKQLGLVGRTKEKILEELKVMYETF